MCPKCGTSKKSDKLSCCARGGSWFKRCGDAGDPTVDHTWSEGVDACKDLSSSISAVRLQEDVVRPLGTAHAQNASQQQRNTHDAESMSVGNIDSNGWVKVSKIVVSTCASFIVSHLRLWSYLIDASSDQLNFGSGRVCRFLDDVECVDALIICKQWSHAYILCILGCTPGVGILGTFIKVTWRKIIARRVLVNHK